MTKNKAVTVHVQIHLEKIVNVGDHTHRHAICR